MYIFRKLKSTDRPSNEIWSGEASRGGGFAVEETRVDVSIGDSNDSLDSAPKKERPIWMVESTVVTNDDDQVAAESLLERVAQTSSQQVLTMQSTSGTSSVNHTSRHKKDNEDIMSVLLAHEKQSNTKTSTAVKGLGNNNNHNSSDSSEDEKEIENAEIRKY